MRQDVKRYFMVPDASEAEDAMMDTTTIIRGMENAIRRIEEETVKAFGQAQKETDKYNQSLGDLMKTMQTYLQEIKTAFKQVAEPIGMLLLPLLTQVVGTVAGVLRGIGLMLGILAGTDTVTEKLKQTEQAEQSLKKTTVSTASAIKRSLAGFDQLNRLNGPNGSTKTTTYTPSETASPETQTDTLSPQLQGIISKILTLIEPLRNIDFGPLKLSLEGLKTAFSGLGSVLSESFAWAWSEIMVPLSTWVIEEAAPAGVDVLTGAFEALSLVLGPVLQGIQNLKVYLEPVVQYIGETVLEKLQVLKEQFGKVAQVFREKGGQIQETFGSLGQIIGAVWEKIRPIMELIRGAWVGVVDTMGSTISDLIRSFIDLFGGLVKFIAGVLTGDWQQAWEGIKQIFVGFVNGVIGAVNGMIRGVVNGINAIIRALNQVRFTLPDWDVLGNLAGKSYGISIKTLSVPQIPYLAQGAVLPANRPFLAMVGDQRHGTNVEAPLATIQEAVALVMDDMIASNTAGQETIVGVLRELLEAVLGIRVGDEVIGRAVQRYNRKMAVVKGEYV